MNAVINQFFYRMFAGLLLASFGINAQSNEIISKVAHHQIEISGFEFVPKQLIVSVGDTITWINKDIVPHNIVDSSQKMNLISPDLAIQETYSFVVEKPIRYKCKLHPSMKGKILLSDLL